MECILAIHNGGCPAHLGTKPGYCLSLRPPVSRVIKLSIIE